MTRTTQIATSAIEPVHEVRDAAKLAGLVESMAVDGWSGRPLLVVDTGNGWYQAWTGSHRYAAAVEAGLAEIPCLVVDDADIDVDDEPHDDDDRMAALIGAELDDAIALMAEEG